ncbi:hypothetical protein, partial [Salmonella enterica]|uniref:hypothetical protein n=1 Tax=Salmonella enterica TaxID=28901 RepID=UPI001F329E75
RQDAPSIDGQKSRQPWGEKTRDPGRALPKGETGLAGSGAGQRDATPHSHRKQAPAPGGEWGADSGCGGD